MKDHQTLLRLSKQEKKAFKLSAKLAGVPLSVWMRERLRLVAIRELESANFKVPFIEDIEVLDG